MPPIIPTQFQDLLKIPRDFDDLRYCEMLMSAQTNLNESAIESISQFIEYANEAEKILLADILGQSFVQDKTNCPACETLLKSLLNPDFTHKLLTAVTYVLGNLRTSKFLHYLSVFCEHPDPERRIAIGFGLGKYDDEDSVIALIALSKDINAEVRNVATFSLGSLVFANSSEVRDVLLSRLADECLDVRFEAIIGLLDRQDERCIDAMKRCWSSFTESQRQIILSVIPGESNDELWTKVKKEMIDQPVS